LRYGGITDRTVDRWAEAGRIPRPFYHPGSRLPFWWLDELEECDRQATRTRPLAARPVA
jgi:hypothetical protein